MSDYSSKIIEGRYSTAPTYEFRWKCRDCGHTYKKKVKTEDPLTVECPPCPKCKKEAKKREGLSQIITEQRAPAYTGTNAHVKAADMAAEMIMQDQGMTDIKGVTDVKTGESNAPKLAPHLQRMADNVFKPKAAMESVGLGNKAGMYAQAAMSGALSPAATNSPDPIAIGQQGRKKPMEVANIIAQT